MQILVTVEHVLLSSRSWGGGGGALLAGGGFPKKEGEPNFCGRLGGKRSRIFL